MFHQPNQDGDEHIVTISVRSADLEGIRGLLKQLLAQVESIGCGKGFSKHHRSAASADLREWARRIINARRARVATLNKSMFGEPAWDMLLELYVNMDYGARHSVGRLCELSDAPPTTALRWLDYLEKEKLVARQENPTDRRTEFVEITEKGRTAMEQYLSDTFKSPA